MSMTGNASSTNLQSSDSYADPLTEVTPSVKPGTVDRPAVAKAEPDLMQRLSALELQSFMIGSVSLSAGILLWYLATEYNFNYFINFENVPSPFPLKSRMPLEEEL